MPRVSVILPNYNYARYLKERVRSILNQTMPDLELLYLDDASTDNSNEIMEAFASDKRVQMHCFEQNSGKVYQRWNDGAKRAQGEWLWFAGADDAASPFFLEKLLALAQQNPRAAILYANASSMNSEGCLTSMRFLTLESQAFLLEDGCLDGFTQLAAICRANWLWTASTLLIRRDAFEEAGGWDARLRQAADADLYLAILHRHAVAFCGEPLSAYRVHSGTVSSNTRLTILLLECAYCRARVYERMREDTRFTDTERAAMREEIQAQLFEAFAEPSASIPAWLRFAAEAIYNVVPDKRLLSKIESNALRN